MIIRKATPEELPAILALVHQSFMEAVAPHFSQEGIRNFFDYARMNSMRERMQANHVTYVAYKEDELVGMAHVKEQTHISMLFVAPKWQRNGIGREILNTIIREAYGDKITVHSGPNSKDAYRKFGFLPTSEEKQVNGMRLIPMEFIP